jgi:hypothetical protein
MSSCLGTWLTLWCRITHCCIAGYWVQFSNDTPTVPVNYGHYCTTLLLFFPFAFFIICMKKIKSWNLNYRFCMQHTAFNCGTEMLSTGTAVQFLLTIVWNEGMSYSRWIQWQDVFAWLWVIQTSRTLEMKRYFYLISHSTVPLQQQQSKTRDNCNLESFTSRTLSYIPCLR